MTPSISEENSGSGSTRTAPRATVASLHPSESARCIDGSTEATAMGKRKSHPAPTTKAVGLNSKSKSKSKSTSKSKSEYTTTRQDEDENENEIIVVGSEDEDEDEHDPVSIATTRTSFQGSTTPPDTTRPRPRPRPFPLESSKPLRKPTPLATALDPLVLTSSDEDEHDEGDDDDGIVQAATAESIAAKSSSNTLATTTKRPKPVGSSQLRGTKRGRSTITNTRWQDASAKVKQEERSSRMNRLAFSDSESDDDDDDDDLLFANASALGKVRSTLLPNLLPNTEATPVGKVPNPHPPPEAVPTTEAATSAVLDDDDDYYSSSHQSTARRRHLEEITHKHDRALQLLLWEIGFGYNIYAHQFEATRFVAGLVPTFPVPSGMTTTNETAAAAAAAIMAEQSANGTQFRSRTLERSALEFSWRLNNNSNNNINKNNNIPAGDDSRFILTLPTKGMLLADEMGLGKTIEALAGAALRNAMSCDSDGGCNNLPTLIVSPQDGIQNQWYETLVQSGVTPSSIIVWGDTKAQTKKRQCKHSAKSSSGDTAAAAATGGAWVDTRKRGGQQQSYILCTRYKIQSELRKLFDTSASGSASGSTDQNRKAGSIADYKDTTLFRRVPWALIGKLRNQYRADKGKEKNRHILPKEKGQDCVARLVRNERTTSSDINHRNVLQQFAFQTIIVDEAHFCKNVLAYWGLGLALLGTQSKRTVLLTGTPYNNGPSDMSALMTYIDPAHEAAKIGWWEDAVGSGDGDGPQHVTANAVSEWRKAYLLRRTKDVLLQKLPPRNKVEIDVGAIPSELWIYLAYEGKFLGALKKLRRSMQAASPEARHRAKKVFELMMACMACMRMALVHPILPGGREATIHFSPSRRHLLRREERPNKCVFCNSDPTKVAEDDEAKKKAAAKNRNGTGMEYPSFLVNKDEDNDEDEDDEGILAMAGTARADMDLDDDQLDDNDVEGDYVAKSKKERELEERKKGPIVPLGPELCRAGGSQCRHFAHEKCIEAHRRSENPSCPRCHDLKSRIHGKFPHNVYCKETCTHIDDKNRGGFTASAKIEHAVKWFQTTVPKNDKAIFLSFFKGSLDLIEGILTSKFGIDCVRYDGDVSKEVRTRDLERFKTSSSCRVLLATVQSGGTGLNITEANHVCFLDRWFNPCVHDQAESRCHRIGQKKDVNIAYLDINFTIDVVMKRINVLKEGNANVVLSDGTSLGDRWSLGYRNVSGVIGNTLNALRDMRDLAIQINGDEPLPPYVESDLEEKLAATTKPKAKSNVKNEEREHKVKPEIGRFLPVTPSFSNHIDLCQSEASKPSFSNYVDLCMSDGPKFGEKKFATKQKHMPASLSHFVQRDRVRVTGPWTATTSRPMTGHNATAYYNRKKTPLATSSSNRPATGAGGRKASSKVWTASKKLFRDASSRVLTENRHASNPRMPNSMSLGGKRSVSTTAATQAPPKRNRFSRGLSAIVSQKQRTKEFMRRKSRGDL